MVEGISNTEVKRTERGWAGPFCCREDCRFRRNTLLVYKEKGIVVSTVGDMVFPHRTIPQVMAGNDYYVTSAFWAVYKADYWEADEARIVEFDSPRGIDYVDETTDQKANDMHEQVVREMMQKIGEEVRVSRKSPTSKKSKISCTCKGERV